MTTPNQRAEELAEKLMFIEPLSTRYVKIIEEALLAERDALMELVKRALQLKGAWREAIVELEDHCSEPVRLKNMLAVADQLDEWADKAREVLAIKEGK